MADKVIDRNTNDSVEDFVQAVARMKKQGETMSFVGREKETKKIIKALQQGNNIILTGKFGMGRTRLMRHVATITQGRVAMHICRFFADVWQSLP